MRRNISDLRGIITGASSGIGRAIALQLLKQGARLAVVARRRELLEELAREDGIAPEQVLVIPGDVTLLATRDAAFESVIKAWGGLDLLINNAGVGAIGRFADASPARMQRVLEVNFYAVAEWTRGAIPLLCQGRTPLVVNVGSILGHRGLPFASEYCASKFALRGLSESIRPELAKLGIDLLLVSPGSTETEFFDHVLEKGEYPFADQKGVPAAAVALATARAIERGNKEIIPSWPGRAVVYLNRFCPWLVDWYLRRFG
jgi:short-subunit dehydrogenase